MTDVSDAPRRAVQQEGQFTLFQRFRSLIARLAIRAGVWIMPKGRVRTEPSVTSRRHGPAAQIIFALCAIGAVAAVLGTVLSLAALLFSLVMGFGE